jgi:hypothetical protein
VHDGLRLAVDEDLHHVRELLLDLVKDDPDFLANINTYMSNSNSSKTQMSGTEKQYNEIQNALNADDENYEAVDIETGAKLPNELAAGMGSNKLAKLRGFISGEDDEDWDNT